MANEGFWREIFFSIPEEEDEEDAGSVALNCKPAQPAAAHSFTASPVQRLPATAKEGEEVRAETAAAPDADDSRLKYGRHLER